MNQTMVLKNMKVLKKNNLEEFPAVEIRYDDTEVFLGLPIALVPYGTEYSDPIVYSLTPQGFGMIIERSELELKLKASKMYYFKLGDEDKLIECDKKESITQVRLPHDFDISKLAYMNGEVLVVDTEEKEENTNG